MKWTTSTSPFWHFDAVRLQHRFLGTGKSLSFVRPGLDTSIDVRARLYPSDANAKIGLAPLTSMYYFGENQPAAHEDYRPEVHDSDGLSVDAGNGEWIWRPLVNPSVCWSLRLRPTIRKDSGCNNATGISRATRIWRCVARSAQAPGWSRWSRWGPGRVELVQIPTPGETNDNIVAYWVPDQPPRSGQPYDLQYRILWQKENERRPPLLWVMQTRQGPGFVRSPDQNKTPPFLSTSSGRRPRRARATVRG